MNATPAPARGSRATRSVTVPAALLVAAAALALVAVCRRREAPPATLDELAARVQRRVPGVRLVPGRRDGRPGPVAYLTTDPNATWEAFQTLSLTPDRVMAWRGAVWVRLVEGDTDVHGLLLSWEGRGGAAGRFLAFGDPDLVAEVLRAAAGR